MKEHFDKKAAAIAADKAQTAFRIRAEEDPFDELHRMRALKTLVRGSLDDKRLELVKAHLNVATTKTLVHAWEGETLEACIRRLALEWAQKGDFEQAAAAGLMGEILETRLHGISTDGIFGWHRAAGKKIDDVWFLYPSDEEKAPATHVLLFLGDETLVLSCTMTLCLLTGAAGKRLEGKVGKSAGKLLPEVTGRRIVAVTPIGPGSCKEHPVSYMIKLDDGTILALQAHCEDSSDAQARPRIKFTILRPIETDWSEIRTDKPMSSEDYKCAEYRAFLI